MPVTYEEVSEASSDVPVGVVIRQDPEPGQYDPNDDIVVTIYVSSGPGRATAIAFSVIRAGMVFTVSQ